MTTTNNTTLSTLAVAALIVASTAAADGSIALQINAVSHHPGGGDFHERNTGIGIQLTEARGSALRRIAFGTLINSMGDRSWYAGAAFAHRFGEAIRIEPGIFLGAVTYPSSGRAVLPAILPVLTLGIDGGAINAIYVPPVRGKTVPAVVFQLTLDLK